MKEAMRDKVCQLIGKYQAEEAYHREKAGPIHSSNWPGTDAVKAECCREFLMDLEELVNQEDKVY